MAEVDFSVSRILRERFRSSPRFGHTSDFSALFSEDDDEFDDYLVGLFATSIVILSIFLIWGFILFVLACCCGKRRAGCLSGAAFEKRNNQGMPNPWIKDGRIIFGASCLLFIVFVIVLVTAGIGNLNTTTTTIGQGAMMGDVYFKDLQTILINVLETVYVLKQLKVDLSIELRLFAVALRQVEEAFLEETANITASVENLLDSVDDLKDLLSDPLEDINSTLTDGRDTMDDIITTTEEVDLTALQVALGLILTALPLFLLGCLYWNAYGTKPNPIITHCRAWIIWPLFILLVAVCVVFCCLVSVGGLLNGDFCNGGADSSPESTIIEILDNKGKDPNSFEYQSLVYMIRECDESEIVTEYPLGDVELFLERLINTDLVVANTIDQIDNVGVSFLTNATDYDVTRINALIQEFGPPLRQLGRVTGSFVEAAVCEPLYEVYSTVTHEAACRDSYKGLFWIFMSLLFMSLFGLLAITFRSALYPVVDTDVDPDLGTSNPGVVGPDTSDSRYGDEPENDTPRPGRTKQIDAEFWSQRNTHQGTTQQIDDLMFV